MPPKNNYLVIAAIGRDGPGLVESISRLILDQGCNITQSRMAVFGNEFTLMLMVEGNWNTLAKLEDALPAFGDRHELDLTFRRTGERESSGNLLPYGVDVVALDHPGIVHNLSSFFSRRKINIEEMTTSTYAAAHTGAPMFSVHMSVGIPSDVFIAGLRDEFMDFCDSLNLDAVLEPIKG
jgi:glycine cleavage system transcriptional repressor